MYAKRHSSRNQGQCFCIGLSFQHLPVPVSTLYEGLLTLRLAFVDNVMEVNPMIFNQILDFELFKERQFRDLRRFWESRALANVPSDGQSDMALVDWHC